MSVIFISHRNAPHDNAFAQKLHAWLKAEKGIGGFLDFEIRHGLQAGEDWEDRIYAEMNRAQVVIALISAAWLESDWCKSEARMARLRGILFIPCLIKSCRLPFPNVQTIDFLNDEQRAFAQLRERLARTFQLPDQPYPGLMAFTSADAAVFFGRDDDIGNLRNELDALYRGRPETPRLLVVLGASGSGKSSLVRAGLIPRLEGTNGMLVVDPFVPAEEPIRELRRALTQMAHRRGRPIQVDSFGPRGAAAEDQATAFIGILEQVDPLHERALIVIDQAEELFRCPNDGFFAFLRAVSNQAAGRIVVLATMRSDFLHELQTSALVAATQAFRYRTFTVDSLPVERLGDIIREPAKRFGVQVEEALVDRLKADIRGPDSLPLLAFFLREFWKPVFTRDGVQSLSEYKAFGGFRTALEGAIDRAINRCNELADSPDHKQMVDDSLHDLFVPNLVAVREVDGAPVRRRGAVAMLTHLQRQLLEIFVRERLLVKGDGYVEVAHEALLRQWRLLVSWIEHDREKMLWLQVLNSSAQAWEEAGRHADYLVHTGDRLAKACTLGDVQRFAALFADATKALPAGEHGGRRTPPTEC